MTSISVECPHCGGMGSVPRGKIQVRLLCPKCHRPFFITPAGHVVPGEPVHSHQPGEAHPPHGPASAVTGDSRKAGPAKADAAEGSSSPWRLPLLLGTLFGLTVGAALAYYAFRSPAEESGSGNGVIPMARAVAESLAAAKFDAVKGASLPGTEADTDQFCKNTRLKLEKIIQESFEKVPRIEVTLPDPAADKDEVKVLATYTLNHGASRSEQIEAAAGIAISELSPVNVTFCWKRVHEGSWRLDGKETLALSRQ